MVGTLLGIARHAQRRGPIEVLRDVSVSIDGGIAGDWRGVVPPGGKGRRQVTVMTRAAWAAALRDLGHELDWSVRRVNLLVDGIDLPQRAGWRLAIGEVRLDVTGECDPCSRMDAIAPGLNAALTPDWRGGRIARVVHGGQIRVGDAVAIEED